MTEEDQTAKSQTEDRQTEDGGSETTVPQSDNPVRKMDPVRKWTFIILALCLLLLGWYLRADRVTPFTQQARIHALVVPIAPEVSGTVESVMVGNNQLVSKGDTLFQIDTDRYELAVQTAEAQLEAARQTQGALIANVASARANLLSAKANRTRAEQDANRMRNIRKEDPGAISIRRLESAEASLAAARAQVSAREANLDKAIQDLGSEGDRNSGILQAQAALDQANLNLERSEVKAPEDGLVTGVRLDRGNFAAAGAPQMTFIATHNIWVQADFSENNLGHIDPGNRVEIIFDAIPGRVFGGTVRDMGFGVAVDTAALGNLPTIDNDRDWLRAAQRFPVLIDFKVSPADGGTRLKVGSQASVVVYTGDYWLSNFLARVVIRLRSILTYAY
jgi:multidrug resistance efflux pump